VSPEARELIGALVANEAQLRRIELEQTSERARGELRDCADAAKRARVNAQACDARQVETVPRAHLLDALGDARGEPVVELGRLPWQLRSRRLDIEHAGGRAVERERDGDLGRDAGHRLDEVRIGSRVTQELELPRAERAGHDSLIERESVPDLLVPSLGDEPQALVLEDVDAREQLVAEAFDESIEGQIDRRPSAVRRERRLRAPDAGGEHVDAERPGGVIRRHAAGSAPCLGLSRSAVLGLGVRKSSFGDRPDFAERGQEGIEDERIELRAPAGAHHADRLVERERGAVHTVARDRIEHVRDARDPSFERNRLPGDAARVAGSVEALVVRQGDRRRDVQQLGGRLGEQPVADLRVPLHHPALGVGQRARLEQDAVGDRDLADVVEAAGEPDQLAALVVELEPQGEQLAVAAHALRVAPCLRVSELGGEREPPDGLRLAELERELGPAKPRDRVEQLVLGAAALAQLLLSGGVEPGVLERERRQASEPGEKRNFRLSERPLFLDSRETEHACDSAAGLERNTDHGAEVNVVEGLRAAAPAVVVVDDEWLAALPDAARKALPLRQQVADPGFEDACSDVHLERRLVGARHIEIAVGRSEEPARAVDDRLEQLAEVEALDQAERGLVQRRQFLALVGDR
jgi:hypothetical protein